MRIIHFEVETDLPGFLKAIEFFEELDNPAITFEHEKRVATVQTISQRTHYVYLLDVSCSGYPPTNLYPVLRDLERVLDDLP